MTIPERVSRLLIAHSGGYCQNPSCNNDLFVYFDSGEVTSIEELAHIIGQSRKGPRGDDELEISKRNVYDNVLLLCPNCHSMVDKVPGEFPIHTLKKWKEGHVQRIRNAFCGPHFENRQELRNKYRELLRENNEIYKTYGPNISKMEDPLADEAEMWHELIRTRLLPNNRSILNLLKANSYLLNEREKEILAKFEIHVIGFERNHTGAEKNASVTTFPKEMDSLLEIEHA